MFTGLVRARGRLIERSKHGRAGALRLRLSRPDGFDDLRLGDSIAVHGCCLTIIELAPQSMVFEAGAETLARTRFATMVTGAQLHLERALKFGDRLDGHLMTGHIDAIAEVVGRSEVAGGRRLQFGVGAALAALLPEKGSVCVDGISLTIAASDQRSFTVELIPETLERTELAAIEVGDSVHVEVDPLARYAATWLERISAANDDQ
jgi:riboflavin synthase